MQESELDHAPLEDSQEWVDVPQNQVTEVATRVEIPQGEGATGDETVTDAQQPEVNRTELMFHSPSTQLTQSQAPLSGSGNFDWAEDEEGGLPSIAGLQAKFGTSETPSPADLSQDIQVTNAAGATAVPTNGNLSNDDDGFTQARGGRGRQRGDRGFRGGRGGERGSFRSNDRSGFRGGFRGERGGSRGGKCFFHGT
jgi:hypothetical protein